MDTFANYHEQRKAFSSLLEYDCEKRIQLFCGESGTGKTALMIMCQKGVCAPVCHIPIQLRNNAVGVAEFFSRASNHIGIGNLPRFSRILSELSDRPDLKVKIHDIQQEGMGNKIQVALNADSVAKREDRQTYLTQALFDDIQALDTLLLVTIDTYEQSTSDMKDWVSGPFLSRVETCKKIRVAVAGQEVPDHNNIEWGHCCSYHGLYGVKEAEDWLPVIKNLGYIIPAENPKDWLGGVCHVLGGKPEAIMKIIQGLPRAQ